MEKSTVIIIAILIFLIFSFIFYKLINNYVKHVFGEKWLNFWSNRLYFWQSLIFMSITFTAITLYFLKWTNILIY